MKMAEMNILEDGDKVRGKTCRLGKELIHISMETSAEKFDTEEMFPRLFVKMTRNSKEADGVSKVVVKMEAPQAITSRVTGSGEVVFGNSSDDPVNELKISKCFGASLTKGHQILPWGEELN
ncbi:MAG: acetoacetate decarboxylase family protein [Rhodospirillales bacterium]